MGGSSEVEKKAERRDQRVGVCARRERQGETVDRNAVLCSRETGRSEVKGWLSCPSLGAA